MGKDNKDCEVGVESTEATEEREAHTPDQDGNGLNPVAVKEEHVGSEDVPITGFKPNDRSDEKHSETNILNGLEQTNASKHLPITSVKSQPREVNIKRSTGTNGRTSVVRGSKLKEDKTNKIPPSRRTDKRAPKKASRSVKDLEIVDKKQSTLTQHFPVRRSERRLKAVNKGLERTILEKKILSGDETNLEVRVLEDKGRGVFSKKKLVAGEFVCEYVGDLIEMQEAENRETSYEADELGCYMYYFQFKNKKYCVDATSESGKVGRLLNHSKTKSNVYTKVFPIDGLPRLILVAKNDIPVDEELVYDYGDRSKASIESHPWLKS